jgi:hypothetical protein
MEKMSASHLAVVARLSSLIWVVSESLHQQIEKGAIAVVARLGSLI